MNGRLSGDISRVTGPARVVPEGPLAAPVPDSVLAQVDKRLANVRCTLQEVRERMRVKDAQLFGEVPAGQEGRPESSEIPGVLGVLITRAKQLDDLAADVLVAVAKYEAV